MSIDPKSIRREGTPDRGRYVHDFADGSQAELTFFEQPAGIVTIDHTETPPQHRGRGVAAAIVAHSVAELRAAGKRIIPACPFVYREFKAHPEWADLLARD